MFIGKSDGVNVGGRKSGVFEESCKFVSFCACSVTEFADVSGALFEGRRVCCEGVDVFVEFLDVCDRTS